MNRTSFLDCNTNMIKSELHLTNSESSTVWLPIEFLGFTSRIISKDYHSLIPVLSQFLETVWVPLKCYPNPRSIVIDFDFFHSYSLYVER